jgi:hypothetical protein
MKEKRSRHESKRLKARWVQLRENTAVDERKLKAIIMATTWTTDRLTASAPARTNKQNRTEET